ncbi:hypothetical protein NE237_032308 [Protea cynaroides]|uniref:Uncharacterized protein n=1 Tax=Protea cynaroides TaxID=273540 RepID=A0A9Q0L457_9MAGN|nr:hypothetical protein NE237_032308 [Protea cynaroides]
MAFLLEYLDLILVPAGLLIMFIYHLHLLYTVLNDPGKTAIGYENHNRMAWVEIMMQGDSSHTNQALSVISNTSSSSIYFASWCLSLSSLIGAWIGSSSGNLYKNVLIFGDKSSTTGSLKYISMLVAFMLAFGSFVQSARYHTQADFFISTPISSDLPIKYIKSSMLRANNFWHIGLRFLYFAMVLVFWSFGPIPMFASCVVTVVILFFLDSNSAPLHQYGKLAKPSVKKMVNDVTAAVRVAKRRGKVVVEEEVASTVTVTEHHGFQKS